MTQGQQPSLVPFEVVAKWCSDFSADQLIGEGAFGKVYRGNCHDSQSARMRVAVKRHMHQIRAATALPDMHSAVDAIRREINVLRSFHHPHIIRLLGFTMPLGRAEAEASDELCLVYEYAGHGGLDKMLKDDGKARLLTCPRRVRILHQLAIALNYLHKRVPKSPTHHRDVKCANFVVDDDLNAKIIDCGLSKFIPEQGSSASSQLFSVAVTAKDMLFGTRQYMCPSYMKSGKYTDKSEIFSFGIVIAEVLTGSLQSCDDENPNDLSDEDVIDRRNADERAGHWPPEVVSKLKALSKACTAAKVDKRIGDMSTVMRQLKELMDGFPSDASDEIAAQLAEARRALDGLKLNEEFQAMQRKQAAADTLSCCICFDSFPASAGVTCSGAAPGHFYCNDCFSSMVMSRVTGEGKVSFIQHGLSIECSVCQPDGFRSVFDMRLLCPHLTAEAYTEYLKTLAEPAVIEAQQRYQDRIREMQEIIDRLEGTRYIKHIQDHLIQPRCPRLDCRALVLDFDHCAHLQVRLRSHVL